MEKLLTIAIAAYNSQDYLPRCLDSLIVEGVMDKVEILVVNDGSTDNTYAIAQEYEKNYPGYFIAIDKPNGNYGSVMNAAIKRAKGKYFRTLDSDDWFNRDGYVEFVKQLEQTDADLVVTKRIVHKAVDNSESIEEYDSKVETNSDLPIEYVIDNLNTVIRHLIIMSICYRTDMIRSSGLKWSEGVFYTDMEFRFWPLHLVKKVRFVDAALYVYFVGRDDQSMSYTSLMKNFHSFDVVANKLVDRYIEIYNPQSPIDRIQHKYIIDALGHFYKNLIYEGEKNLKSFKVMEEKIKKIPGLYEEIGEKAVAKGVKYLKYYRNSSWHPVYRFLRCMSVLRNFLHK